MSDESDVERLIASITNREPVGSETAAGRPAGAGPEARVAALRGIARIAAFNHSQQREGCGSTAPLPFERWGELVLLERLGGGAHAEVFRAWDTTLQRDVALKLLRDGIVAEAASSPLLEEGRAAARVRHPHVVAIYGVARHEGRVGLWMELVRGPSLERWVERQGPVGPADAAALGIAIGAAVTAVHEAGLLHRDLKPANVVRDSDRGWMLTDFGLGLREKPAGVSAGRLSGTPMFMAPECLAGGPQTERAEVYALGLLLWFALAGRYPYPAASIEELRDQVRVGPPPRLRGIRGDVPEALDAIVARGTATRPAERYPSAQALVDALQRWLVGTTTGTARSRRAVQHAPTFALAALVVGAVLAATLLPRALGRGTRTAAISPPTAATDVYDVEATLERAGDQGASRLVAGDRVRPGDDLSLAFRSTRPAWVYVLNEDDAGERYLLFPQPLFDTRNPLPADSTVRLPGTIGGRLNYWTVSSRGGRERFLVVASPEPVAALEQELARLPAPLPDRPIRYAPIGAETVDLLRGTGRLSTRPESRTGPTPPTPAFDRFRALADRESGVRGTWVRQIILENP